ncbi:MAG: GDSL-type esterase/lipase family protein, partial [Acidimicrobiales bacterium]
AAACGGAGCSGGADRAAGGANRSPDATADALLAVTVGDAGRLTVSGGDPDGDPVRVSWGALPEGAVAEGRELRFSPADAGEWTATATLEDGRGGTAQTVVLLRARHPARPHTLAALGDSVASGHGLDGNDLAGGDRCFRAEAAAYPKLALDQLSARGALGGGSGELVLAACSGHTAAQVASAAVPAPAAFAGEGDGRSQLEWAVRANPRVAVITAGANDIRFSRPAELLAGDGTLDEATLRTRLDAASGALDAVLRRLLTATDAVIVLTTYHNPTGAEPRGVPGCAGACFAQLAERVSGELNLTVRDAAARSASARVVTADPGASFAGHGAGPARASTAENPALAALFERVAGGAAAYCGQSAPPGGTWVSALDCVHPNAAGAAAYADAVLRALDEAHALG